MTSDSRRSESARDMAVRLVDRHHGYAIEFSPSPSAHHEDYYTVERLIRRFWPAYWTCGSCHASFPKDHEGDWCNRCDVRLRRNDDVRLALAAVWT